LARLLQHLTNHRCMKRAIASLLISVSSLGVTINQATDVIATEHTSIDAIAFHPQGPKNGRIDSIDELIQALIYVESRGISDAVGDSHLAEPSIGCLQIRPVMVRETNRILEKSRMTTYFRMRDRFDCDKSVAIFRIWVYAYHRNSSYEKIARNWNGGPHGYLKPETEAYWESVRVYVKKAL